MRAARALKTPGNINGCSAQAWRSRRPGLRMAVVLIGIGSERGTGGGILDNTPRIAVQGDFMTQPSQRQRPGSWRWWLAGAVLVLALAGVVVWQWLWPWWFGT